MPRKPTPSILNETPVEEEAPAVVEVEIPVPPEAVKAAEVVDQVVAEASAAVEEATASVEEIVQEAVAEVFPEEEGEAPAEQEITIGFKLPIPSPLYKPLHTMVLASLGVVSYAVEESKIVIHKLVERGEITEKEGVKLLNEVAKRAKRKPKAETTEEAVEPAAEGEQAVKVETVEVVVEEAAAPVEEEEEIDEEASKIRPKNVFNVNLFSPGSTVNIVPAKKPKK